MTNDHSSDDHCVSYTSRPDTFKSTVPFTYVTLNFNNNFMINAQCLIDSGSDFCMIHIDSVPMGARRAMLSCDRTVSGIGNSRAMGKFELDWSISGITIFNVTTLVMPDPIPLVLGLNLLVDSQVQDWHLNATELYIELSNGESATAQAKPAHTQSVRSFASRAPVLSDLRAKLEWIKSNIKDLPPLHHENATQLEQVADLIISNANIFSSSDELLGEFPHAVSINTSGNPIAVRQHAIAQAYRDKVDDELSRMLKLGVIRVNEDSGGWNTPLLVVGKRDGKPRMVANFKESLNKRLTKAEPFLIPSCDELMAEAEPNCTMFSQMDMEMGYWQLRISTADQKKTSFQWKGTTYCYVRLPMGFSESGAIFARAIHSALSNQNLDRSKILVYLDDLVIQDKCFVTFLESHRKVFESLKKFNLKLKPSKCVFFRKAIKFLGRILTKCGVTADPAMVSSVNLIRPPKNKRECQQLIGRLSYLRSFASVKMGESVASCNFSALFTDL